MTNLEFTEYVLNNMNRATLPNALNITNKLTTEFDIFEFLNNLIDIVESKMLNKKDVAYRILSAAFICRDKLNSEIKYNKTMVIDDLIISIWEAINGTTNIKN